MINSMLRDAERLEEIIDAIDAKDYDTAKDKAYTWKENLLEEVDKIESDIDVQLQLEFESKEGR